MVKEICFLRRFPFAAPMKSLLLATLALPTLLLGETTEWIPLFDGQSTEGWTPRAEVVSFEAKDGQLQILSKKNVWIVTDQEFDDFIVEAEVLLPSDAAETGFNSGLAFRCSGEGKPKGYQLEIDLKKPGGVFGIGLGGWLYPSKDATEEYESRVKDIFKPTEWNSVRVVCSGPRIQTYVNDVLIADIEDSQSLKGYFGIQHHGKGDVVSFRNLRVRKTN